MRRLVHGMNLSLDGMKPDGRNEFQPLLAFVR